MGVADSFLRPCCFAPPLRTSALGFFDFFLLSLLLLESLELELESLLELLLELLVLWPRCFGSSLAGASLSGLLALEIPTVLGGMVLKIKLIELLC